MMDCRLILLCLQVLLEREPQLVLSVALGSSRNFDCFEEGLWKCPFFVLLHCIRRARMVLDTFIETWKWHLS